MEESIRSKGVSAIFGSSMEKRLSKELGIPLIKVSYPVLDAVSIANIPYTGFNGTINLAQTIINAIIGQG